MHRLLGITILAGILLAAASTQAGAQGPAPGTSRKYPAGWNLVAIPPGTTFPTTGPLLTAQPGDTNYEQVQPAQETVSGFGYWAYVSSGDQSGYSAPVALSGGSSSPYSVNVPAADWILVGNPSGLLQANVQGADTVYTFDPLNGYQLATTLQPGQGAWVGAANGGLVTVTPLIPAVAPQPAATSTTPPASQSSPASISVASSGPLPLNSAMPNPTTALEPVPQWSWWPFPPPAVAPPPYPGASSPPIINFLICPGDVLTIFALNFCGGLSGHPGPYSH